MRFKVFRVLYSASIEFFPSLFLSGFPISIITVITMIIDFIKPLVQGLPEYLTYLTKTQYNRGCYYCPHYTQEDREAEKGCITCPRSLSQEVLQPRFKAKFVQNLISRFAVAHLPGPLTIIQNLPRDVYLKAHIHHFQYPFHL